MKWITAEPVINVTHDSEGTVKSLEKEISLLKQELAMHDSLANRSSVPYDPLTDVQVAEIKSQIHKYLQGATDEIDIINFRQVQEVFRQFKLIVRQQEDEVETRLRSKYVLIDKRDFAAIAAAQKVGTVDVDDHLLKRYDLGTRLSPISPNSDEKKSRTSSERSKKEGTKRLPSGRDLAAHLPPKSQGIIPTRNLNVKEKARNEDTANIDAQPSKPISEENSQRPSSPPSRAVAFEQFKEEGGSEINRIFKENKSILLARKKRSSVVAQRINIIKREMEDITKALEAQRQERLQQGEYVDEKGRLIIDEKEFLLIMKLKDLKEEYRCSYAELQDLKAEIQYCQHLVNRCRNKLISEFEIWYSESFLIPTYVQKALKPGGNIRPGMIPINRVMCLEEDEQDRFERMQEAMLPAAPDSVSFYKAKMKTDQKVTSAGPSSLQHCQENAFTDETSESNWVLFVFCCQRAYSRTVSSLKLMHKKPGRVTTAGKDKTLSFLHVT
ncbi:hypothetical protein ASZ78_016205 [Callipepla squamata]|uniref:Kinesin-like protein KIF6/9 C-terminal domain-containing protein n=1 Tax=Callipepla squamata TaxID=9009 RepID=A0A226N950_CALSU|nr:hypothetical protein ASZ78_016205 [Callipepla squamata]